MTLLIREIECEAVSHKMDGSYYLYGFVVQWLGHAAVNRSIGVQIPAFPCRGYYSDDTGVACFIVFNVPKTKIAV